MDAVDNRAKQDGMPGLDFGVGKPKLIGAFKGAAQSELASVFGS
jgi:hypothetical protein